MNAIIMNYLVTEGYAKAAQDFANEANINPGVEISTIEQRKKIKNAIYSGRIQEAIEDINDIDSTVRSFFSLCPQYCRYDYLVSCTTHRLPSFDDKKYYFSPQNEQLNLNLVLFNYL
jgi:hypothetical protein